MHDGETGAVLLRVDSGHAAQFQAVCDPTGGVVAVIGPVKVDARNSIVVYSPYPLFDGQSPDAAASQGYGTKLFAWFSQHVEVLATRGRRHAVGSVHLVQPPLDVSPFMLIEPSGEASGSNDLVVAIADRVAGQSWMVSLAAESQGRLAILLPDSATAPQKRAVPPAFTYSCPDENMRAFLFKDAAGEVAMRMKQQKLKRSPLALCHDLTVAEGCDAALLVCAVASHVRLDTAMHQSVPNQMALVPPS